MECITCGQEMVYDVCVNCIRGETIGCTLLVICGLAAFGGIICFLHWLVGTVRQNEADTTSLLRSRLSTSKELDSIKSRLSKLEGVTIKNKKEN